MRPRTVRGRLAAAVTVWLLVGLGARVVVALPEHCPDVTSADLRAAASEAVGWLVRNQAEDGRWVYRYDVEADEVLPGYNTVRHSGVIMSLYQAAAAGTDGALQSADAGTAYALDNMIRHDAWMAFEPTSDRVTAGAAALLVAGLAERRLLTGEPRYDEAMAGLSRFLVELIEPSGAVIESWDRRTREPRYGSYSPFFTGETYWALALMHLLFPGGGWDEPAQRIGHYLATERDKAEGYFPDLPDHWAAYGLWASTMWPAAAGTGRPLTPEQLDYVRRQAALGGVQVRWESQRVDDFPRYLLRGRRTLGAGLGTVGEQLGALWQVAEADPRLTDLAQPISERAVCVAAMLTERQVGAEESSQLPRPGLARGAWFQFGVTQMDDQQHALSAILLALLILETEENRR